MKSLFPLPLTVALIGLSACHSASKSQQETGTAVPPPDLATLASQSGGPVPESDQLAPGTVIPVEVLEMLDSTTPVGEDFILGKVADPVLGSDGKLAIAAGSTALMLRRNADRPGDSSVLVLTLYSVARNGHQYRLDSSTSDAARDVVRADQPGATAIHLTGGSRVAFKLPVAWQIR